LVYYAGSWQDNELLCRDAGNLEEAKAAHKINDLLLPLIKGYSSEKVYELLSVSLQCMGGSGYVQDHPHEQYIRDQKIDTLYEGTTHIQALDLFFRKIARDGGANLKRLMGFIRETVEKEEGGDALAAERRALDRALADVASILETMQTKVMESIYHVGLHGNRILFALSELVIGWLLVRHAALAQDKLGDAHADDQAFYEGKIASARFFCRNVLPQAQLARKIIESGDLDLMEISEEAF